LGKIFSTFNFAENEYEASPFFRRRFSSNFGIWGLQPFLYQECDSSFTGIFFGGTLIRLLNQMTFVDMANGIRLPTAPRLYRILHRVEHSTTSGIFYSKSVSPSL
jgi:hypothetical protein